MEINSESSFYLERLSQWGDEDEKRNYPQNSYLLSEVQQSNRLSPNRQMGNNISDGGHSVSVALKHIPQ